MFTATPAVRNPLVVAIATGLCLAPPAWALDFQVPNSEIGGYFDTTISVGASWRAEGRDKSLIAIANGGTSRDPNSDDGNLNYDKGDTISAAIKVTHDLDVKYSNLGFFGRASYFYDRAADRKDELGDEAQDRMISDFTFLDSYVYGNFEIAGRRTNARLGSQVVSWGESTFILNGINSINPVDVTKLRVAGAELREGLTPTPMAWVSQEITENLSAEALYIFNFEKTEIDPRGSFFSTTEIASDDSDAGYTGFGRRNDQHGSPGLFPLSPDGWAYAPRSADRNPSDDGQYGLALRWFVPELNNTEFGVYHLNYHSRTPFVSGYKGGLTVSGIPNLSNPANPLNAFFNPNCTVINPVVFQGVFANNPANLYNALTFACLPNPSLLSGQPGLGALAAFTQGNSPAGTYFLEYPENIRLFGVSFNTSLPYGVALQGEYSYRPNQPIQLPTAEILGAALGIQNQITGTGVGNIVPGVPDAYYVPNGTEIRGWRRVQMQQVQFTATKAFGPMLGAEQTVLLGEVGYTHLNLPDIKLFGPGAHLPQPGSNTSSSFGSTSSDGFATGDSWGYRLLARMDFPNAIGAVTVSPRVAFTHDVEGVSPTFNEDTMSFTLGFGFNYQQSWTADVSYTAFWGGRTYSGTDCPTNDAVCLAQLPPGQPRDYASSANPLKDRDFFAVSLSYSF